jgi:hypothetical protein
MSSTTPATYTSAATQTTPLTSQPAMSVSAALSHQAKSPETGPSPITTVALRPRHAANAHEDPLNTVFSLITKSTALIIGASIERQLMLSATTDIFTAHIFFAILWFMFGGHRKLLADDPVPPLVPPNASRRASSNVKSWLGKLHFDVTTTVVIPPGLCLEVTRVDSGQEDQKTVAIDVNDADQASLKLPGMVEVVSRFEDHCDVLASMDSIAIEEIYDAAQTLLEFAIDEPESAAPMDEGTPIQDHCALQPGLSLTTTGVLVLAKDEHWLSALLKQHEYPTFQLYGEDDEGFQEAMNHNFCHPIIAEHVSEVCSNYSGWPTIPGRPVVDDEQDIKFLYDAVCDDVPAYVIKALELHSPEYWSRYRCGISFSNLCRETLVLQWHALNLPDVKIESLDDVMAIDLARVRRFREECPIDERELHGPDSELRAYLLGQEEEDLNDGCYSQCKYMRWEEEVCSLKKQMKGNPAYEKLSKQQSPALAWLNNMDEFQQLDPNSYDDCDCMRKAAELIWEYRNENEHDYDSSLHTDFLYFPSRFTAPEELGNQWASKIHGKETAVDDRIPRCQQFKQNCTLHEMVTNNIFVAVDTAY